MATAKEKQRKCYLPPDTNGNYSPVVQLFCGNDLLDTGYRRWNAAGLNDYLYYLIDGKPLDQMFRSVLFSPVRMRSGRFLDTAYAGFESPSNRADWSEWLDELFHPGSNLMALRESVVGSPLGLQPVDVWVTMPYPEATQDAFGKVSGRKLNFVSTQDRLAAVTWWLQEFSTKWNQAGLEGPLRWRGVNFARSVINDVDLDFIPLIAQNVHNFGKQMLWLTHYGSAQAAQWKALGFDIAVLYANYRGNNTLGKEWIDYTSTFAATYDLGFQWRYSAGLLDGENELYDYFNKGLRIANDYMGRAFTVATFDNTSIRQLYEQRLPLYIALYSFNKGIYQKWNYPGIEY